MKPLIFTIAMMPGIALAQFDDYIDQYYDEPAAVAQPVYGIPVQPILPVPKGNGPWGTGYSIVTTTRSERPNLLLGQDFERDITDSETVTKVVPNDAVGNPIRGLDW